ncbi:MAG: hypothetical protein QOK20_443, partial [Acidimicrobiaceae bacterium]|nr:hypothetical protein [Acidimicrobiaceae bacterium]
AAKSALDEAGIEMPVPQRAIRLLGGPGEPVGPVGPVGPGEPVGSGKPVGQPDP